MRTLPAVHSVPQISERAEAIVRERGFIHRYPGTPLVDPTRDEYIYMYPPLVLFDECDETMPYGERPSAEEANAPIGVYVHIPYCRRECPFCHYVKQRDKGPVQRQAYLQALADELVLVGRHVGRRPVTQLHFGGGTPTVLTTGEWTRLLDTISAAFQLKKDVEITVEASPETVSEGGMKHLARLDVNRVSLGVQSFDNAVLTRAGRGHTADEAKRAFAVLRKAGIPAVNLDLIYGLPGQTLDTWERTLNVASSLRPEHLTIFRFRLRSSASTYGSMVRKELPLGPDVLTMAIMASLAMETAGYVETVAGSCWARTQGHLYEHQDHKYAMGDYVGVGVSSHSYIRGCAYVNERASMALYIETLREGRLPIRRGVRLTPDQTMSRFVVLGLKRGFISITDFKNRFGVELKTVFADTIESLNVLGLMELAPAELRLTAEGRLFCNDVCEAFFTPTDRTRLRQCKTSGAYGSYLIAPLQDVEDS